MFHPPASGAAGPSFQGPAGARHGGPPGQTSPHLAFPVNGPPAGQMSAGGASGRSAAPRIPTSQMGPPGTMGVRPPLLHSPDMRPPASYGSVQPYGPALNPSSLASGPAAALLPAPQGNRNSSLDTRLISAMEVGESSADSFSRAGHNQNPMLSKDDPGSAYQNIGVHNNVFQLVDDIRNFPLHFKRAMETEGLLVGVASSAERAHLWRKIGINKPVLVNVMVWRRSVMKVLVVCMTVSVFTACVSAGCDMLDALEQFSKPPMKADFARWSARARIQGKPHEFADYSWAVTHEMQRLMLGQAAVVQAIGSSVLAVLGLASLALILMAQIHWDRFRRSRRLLMTAWFVAVAAPFLVSTVPARLYVDWSKAQGLVETYRDDLGEQIGFDSRVQQLREGCDRIRTEGNETIAGLEGSFETVCGVIDRLPTGNVPMPTGINVFKWSSLDLAPAHQGCSHGRSLVANGKPAEVLEKAIGVCAKMDVAVQNYQDNSYRIPQYLNYFANRMRTVAETSICMMLALRNFGTLFPAALSIAPGLLKGALRMKMLVPQSIVPGMFVLLLPWLYCPLSWSLYSIIFQFVGNPLVLLGLLVVAFTPLTYCILGKWYQMDRPMTDSNVIQVTRSINNLALGLQLVGYFALGFWLLHFIKKSAYESGFADKVMGGEPQSDPGSDKENELLSRFLTVEDWNSFVRRMLLSVVTFTCSILKAFFLTGAAGADWMVGEMLEFYQLERSMNDAMIQDGKGGSAGNGKMLTLAKEARERMDELLILNRMG